ncbi:diguanylate cyclase (GGDEF)-like protein/PAS domain S-box-containing protein [Oxalobacteraceae bacterium GrIS 2.11]
MSKLTINSTLHSFNLLSMLRRWSGLGCLALALGLAPSQVPAADQTPAKLRVAMDDDYPPYIFRDSNGALTGYLVDVWKLWATKTGVSVELVATDWNLARQNMDAGRVDVIDTIFQTREREKTLDFMPSYVDIPVSIYVHLGIGGISDLNTLKGFLVAVKEGDSCIGKLQEAGINTLETYPNYETLIKGATEGGAKVFCLDEPPANYLLYRNNAEVKFNKAFKLYEGAFHRAVHKGDTRTMSLLQRGFSAMSAEELKAIDEKWMGTPLNLYPYSRYLVYALSGIAALAGLLSLWGLTLRRLVRQRTEQLYTERSQLRTLVKTIPDMIWLKDKDGVYLSCNPRFEQFFGKKEADIIGKTDYDFVDRELADSFRRNDQKAMQAGAPTVNEEWITFASDQSKCLVETIKTPVIDSKGDLIGVLGIARDITTHHQTKQELQSSENFFQTLAVVNPVAIIRTDANRKLVFVNQCWSDITGIPGEQALGKNWNIGIHRDDLMLAESEKNMSFLERRPFNLEFRMQQPGGKIRWVLGQAVATRDENGKVNGFVGTITDITNRKASEDEIRHLAFYDVLTRLPNRRLLYERLQQALKSAHRVHGMGAVLFIDLDNFKSINDTSGHEMGDQLLQQVAPILTSCVRDSDTVARLGGDEFVIILEGLPAQLDEALAHAKALGSKVLLAINQTYLLGQKEYHTTGSIGITMFGIHTVAVDELLKQADLAMYQAKLAGRNTLRFFDVEMQAAATRRAGLESEIRKGILEQQFLLHYQPQIDAQGKLFGVESLVRWQHPRRGLVSPADFIGLAEETGLILHLGAWVLKQACTQLVAWVDHAIASDITIAVNVSSRQFKQADFVEQVLQIIDATGANPRKLKLELTETMLLDNVDDVIGKMTALKSHGIQFALDDFGTGYSSLSYLKRLPLDQLKIDRSFVRDVLTDPDDAVIAQSIISLGKSLGLSVIAEGVETIEQRQFLFEHGCHEYQGFLFSKLLALPDFEQFLAQYR